MARKKDRGPKYPPSGFWLSPGGAVIPVNVHAEALMQFPKVFGFDRAPHGKDEVNVAMATAIMDGFIRGRLRDYGNLWVQVEKPDQRTLGRVVDFLLEYPFGISGITVKSEDPDHEWPTLSFQDFVLKSWPTYWERNPKRKS